MTIGTSFYPDQLTVLTGSIVYWIKLNGAIDQYDSGAHNVVFNNGAAASGTLPQWGTYSYTFNTPGAYTYRCTIHPGMQGTIIAT